MELWLCELPLLELPELLELPVLELDCQLRDLELAELGELAVLAVLCVLRLCVLAELTVLRLWVLRLCEDTDEALCGLIEECVELSVLWLENEVLDMVCEPMIVLICASTSVISVVRFVP